MKSLHRYERAAEKVASLDDLLRLSPAIAPGKHLLLPASASPAAAYAANPRDYSWLLESTLPGPPLGRYSFLTGPPRLLLWHRAGITYLAAPRSGDALAWAGDPFAAMQAITRRYPAADWQAAPTPFPAGLAGYLGYNLRRWIERTAPGPPDDIGLPDCLLGLYDSTLTFDHVANQIIATAPDDSGLDRWRDLLDRVSEIALPVAPPDPVAPGEIGRSMDPATYLAAARTVLDHIYRGDIYQANLTQRWDLPYVGDAWALYLRLRRDNPAPFAAFLGWPDGAVVSASPERFLQLTRREVITRPIKGTRPRGATPTEDRRLRDELAASEKDRAENVMIVDLLRNDIGRVCRIGSVHVPELLAVESYATVHHLVSTVAGELAEGKDAVDLLRACWPGGSITGAPKIRAMEIIAELEPVDRGVYCGSVGYLGLNGSLDTSIVIRTAVLANGRAYVNAGGGIVADSDPAAEYRESIDKAAALLRALGADPAALASGVQPGLTTP